MDAAENEPSPAKNRKTYVSSFQDDWTTRSDYRNWLIKIDIHTAKCTFCRVPFTVKHDGEKAVKTHLNSAKHKENSQNVSTNQLMTAFMPTKGSSDELKIAAAEIAEVYHGIRHHHSYLSIDCGVKLHTQIFSDSNIVKKLHCGRTKAEALVENVLAPKSIEMVVQDLKAATSCPVPFSIATDASNKGHRKFFPIAIKYFDINVGVKDRIIEFYEDSDESSASICDHIISCVEGLGLDMTNVTSYTADNASVNYGIHNSVYQKLTAANKDIVKSNCNCHVIHNAARHACQALSYDVENFVLKVYADFANSAKKTAKLKECFEFLDLEYEDVLRHVVTRWLSLFRAVERLIHCWPAVKEYFITEGEENTHKVIWSFVGGQEDELENDLGAAISLPECYLYFVHHFMFIMTQTISVLERRNVMISEVHDIMVSLREKLHSRIEDRFFGSKVNSALRSLSSAEKKKIEQEAMAVYKKALDYIEKWYDFDQTPFQHFAVLNLQEKDFSYEKFVLAAEAIKIEVDRDALYDEVQLLKKVRAEVAALEDPVDVKWVKVFSATHEFLELPKIVAKVLSIPISNAYVERVFSIMGNVWTDEKNKMGAELVKAELVTILNYDLSCGEFFKFVSETAQRDLLKKVSSNQKYVWKK